VITEYGREKEYPVTFGIFDEAAPRPYDIRSLKALVAQLDRTPYFQLIVPSLICESIFIPMSYEAIISHNYVK